MKIGRSCQATLLFSLPSSPSVAGCCRENSGVRRCSLDFVYSFSFHNIRRNPSLHFTHIFIQRTKNHSVGCHCIKSPTSSTPASKLHHERDDQQSSNIFHPIRQFLRRHTTTQNPFKSSTLRRQRSRSCRNQYRICHVAKCCYVITLSI